MIHQSKDLKNLGHNLVLNAYPELLNEDMTFLIGNVRAYGQVRWTSAGEIRISCHKEIRKWPEPAIIGLLSHELSHPSLGEDALEEEVDRDVIRRGLGHYLAVERAFVGKHDDHLISRGRDRYLGVKSIRGLLNAHEHLLLSNLLEDFNIVQSGEKRESFRLLHDASIFEDTVHSVVRIEGRIIQIGSLPPDVDIKLLLRDKQLIVYADDKIVSSIDWNDD